LRSRSCRRAPPSVCWRRAGERSLAWPAGSIATPLARSPAAARTQCLHIPHCRGISGSLGAPDVTTGRGLLTLDIGGTDYKFAYYVVAAGRLLLVNMNPDAQAERLAGFSARAAASMRASHPGS
jgi:hypothetical protein